MAGDRISCCIPECRRSFKRRGEENEIMCGRCWRTTDPRLRARYKLLRRRMRRIDSLLQRKAIRGNRRRLASGRGFLWRARQVEELIVRAFARNWAAIKEDATIKSALRVEGTAGAIAARKQK